MSYPNIHSETDFRIKLSEPFLHFHFCESRLGVQIIHHHFTCWWSAIWICILEEVDKLRILCKTEREVARNDDTEDSFLEAIFAHYFTITRTISSHKVIDQIHTSISRAIQVSCLLSNINPIWGTGLQVTLNAWRGFAGIAIGMGMLSVTMFAEEVSGIVPAVHDFMEFIPCFRWFGSFKCPQEAIFRILILATWVRYLYLQLNFAKFRTSPCVLNNPVLIWWSFGTDGLRLPK